MTLYCYILGTPVNSAIPVDIGESMKVDNFDVKLEMFSIGHIKKVIWPNNDRANELKLWKFVTPLKRVNNELKELNDKFRDKIDLTQKLGEDLSPDTKFIKEFSDWKNLPDEYIHIIVQPPATTGKCLPMFYFSNKEICYSLLHFF